MNVPPARWNWLAALAEQRFAIIHDLVPLALVDALRDEARCLHRDDQLARAGIGRAGEHAVDGDIRTDRIAWLGRESEAQAAYLDLMETVRLEVNRALLLGLWSYEAHFAAYEPGGHYARHLDAFRGARNRILSTVLYLNPDWRPDDGGELAVFPAGSGAGEAPLLLVAPEAGAFVAFLSEEVPHEVRIARRTRYSVAGWFRVNDRLGAPALQPPAGPVPRSLP